MQLSKFVINKLKTNINQLQEKVAQYNQLKLFILFLCLIAY
jgi:hypothetical protein